MLIHFQVLLKIFVPLAKPVLAVISIYTIVGVWNSWMPNMIFQSKRDLHGVQMYLQRLLLSTQVDLLKLMQDGATKALWPCFRPKDAMRSDCAVLTAM